MDDLGPPPVVVLGVSGSGKSTVAEALADRLAVPWLDADVLHPAANVAKMRAGVRLDDADRWPWLDRAGAWLSDHDGSGGVLACSALKRAYRDRLVRAAPRTRLVQLTAERATIERRLAHRVHPFMPASLLDSQYADLEPLHADEPGIAVDAHQPVAVIVETCLACLAS